MAAPRSRRCALSLLTLFSISLILISVSLFLSTKPTNKPLIDYRNQFSISVSSLPPLLSPLGQSNTTITTLAPISSPSPPLFLLGESNTTNTTLVSASSPSPSPPLSLIRNSNTTNTTLALVSSFSDEQNQTESPSPTIKKVLIRKRSSLDKIESDLAKARAAIKKAALTQNYVSSLYKNPAAFHQLSLYDNSYVIL